MKTIKITYRSEIPENFTGIVEWPSGTRYWFKEGNYHREDGPAVESSNGTKEWYKEGKRHREDGPAIEWIYGSEEWWLEDKHYPKINLNGYIVLDYYKGEYDFMWHSLLGKDSIFEYPNIPGLIEK